MYYFKNDSQITVIFSNGESAVWSANHPDFKDVEALCELNAWSEILVMHNAAKAVLTEDVTIEDNFMSVAGAVIDLANTNNPIFQFIELLRKKGVVDTEIERIKPFLRNMFENPFINAVTEIYDYCKAMDFEITDDGCFLAYKNVRSDLGSIYDNGRTKHVIGEYTEEKMYDTDREHHCSNGLHFCSKGYLQHYPGQTTIIVKVNPKDVVSIPTDYQFMKGRCRKYMTVGILEDKKATLAETDIEKLSNNTVKTVKKEEKKTIKSKGRILQTAQLMKKFKNDKQKVADKMGISVATVERNMRKYRNKQKKV